MKHLSLSIFLSLAIDFIILVVFILFSYLKSFPSLKITFMNLGIPILMLFIIFPVVLFYLNTTDKNKIQKENNQILENSEIQNNDTMRNDEVSFFDKVQSYNFTDYIKRNNIFSKY